MKPDGWFIVDGRRIPVRELAPGTFVTCGRAWPAWLVLRPLFLAILAVLLAFAVAAVALLACGPRPPPSPPAPSSAACSPAARATPAEVCDGFFTADGHACVRCENVAGCVDAELAIYCVAAPCARDPACAYSAEAQP